MMKVKVTFKHMASSEPLIEYVTEKLHDKVGRFFDREVTIEAVLSVERFYHRVHLELHGWEFSPLNLEEQSEDMYTSINNSIEKLSRAIIKQKEKVRTRKGDQGPDDHTIDDDDEE